MSGIFFHQFRNFASKSSKTALTPAELIKSYNYENKALFGEVKRLQRGDGEEAKIRNDNETKISSEMYWLLEHKPVMQKKNSSTRKARKSGKKCTPVILHNTSNDLPSTISLSNVQNRHVLERLTTVDTVEIPFSNKGLKSILRFPLAVTDAQGVPETNAPYGPHYPSVGRILQATLSATARKALINWKLRKMQELGEDGFYQLQQSQLSEGKLLHKTLEDYFSTGVTPHLGSDGYKLWASVLPVLEKLNPHVKFAEKMVEHPFLKYRGVVDCVCSIGSESTVIEWKKSDKLKMSLGATYDAPLQLTAYLGALSADPQYRIEATKGYVIVANPAGLAAQVHRLDPETLQKYWQLWLQRLQEFWVRTRDGTLPDPI